MLRWVLWFGVLQLSLWSGSSTDLLFYDVSVDWWFWVFYGPKYYSMSRCEHIYGRFKDRSESLLTQNIFMLGSQQKHQA